MVQAASRAFASGFEYAKPQLLLKPKPHADPAPRPVACCGDVKPCRDPKPMPAEQIKPIRDPEPMPPVEIKPYHDKKPMPWDRIKPKCDPRPPPPGQTKPKHIGPVGPPIKVDLPPDQASDHACMSSTGGIKPIRCYAGASVCAADLYTAVDLNYADSKADVEQVGIAVQA